MNRAVIHEKIHLFVPADIADLLAEAHELRPVEAELFDGKRQEFMAWAHRGTDCLADLLATPVFDLDIVVGTCPCQHLEAFRGEDGFVREDQMPFFRQDLLHEVVEGYHSILELC